MENIKTFEVDGNRLIADFEINIILYLKIMKVKK